MVSKYKLLNNVIGWVVFAIATFTYVSTIEPTTSFWDCGEYILSCLKLEVGHPPGAPTFLLFGRFFSLFASGENGGAAMINVLSGLSSAFTILFMFWSLTLLGRKLVASMGQELNDARMWAVFASAAVGSLAYTFSDSFWFSAVEGEVYAMSSFFTALVFWAILRWDADDTPRADKWIVFIAFMMGLSIGVHLLNLLAIPAIVMIVYFKKYEYTFKGLIISLLVAVGLLGVIQNGIIPGVVSAAANYELFFVNTIGLPFNVGTIVYFLLLIGMIITGMQYTAAGGEKLYKRFIYVTGAFFGITVIAAMMYSSVALPFITAGGVAALIYYFKDNRHLLNTILLSFSVMLIGYSTFFVLVIRSQANTPMDENNPENAISLLSYLQREQYGDWPLLYGPYYNATLDYSNPADDGNPVYAKNASSGDYQIVDHRKQTKYNWAPEMSTILPRMWEMNQSSHKREYEHWADVKKKNVRVKVQVRTAEGMQTTTLTRPSFGANLKYFFNYQIGWMYMRYFMWNFAGKQNDIQGHGNITDGNWQSGLSATDKIDMGKAPKRLRENAANNKFFMLPLILGLIGLFFQVSKDWKNGLVVTLMFLFTGLAIVFYLNQYPLQPRERDYAYAGSFYAFAMWIGFGVYAIYDFLARYAKMAGVVGVGIATVASSTVPYIMAAEGWDDHNRSHRYTARDFAKNYLSTVDKNGVIFTNGDNDTFPLWYAQEAEGYRTDVRVLNLSLLNTDWYIEQSVRKAYDSDPVPFSLPAHKYRQGSAEQVFFPEVPEGKVLPAMSARQLIDMIINNDPQVTEVRTGQDDNNEMYTDTVYTLPTNRVWIPVDKKLVKSNGTVPANTPDSLILDRIEWTINKRYLLKADLMMLDLLATNNWKRPVYFAVTAGSGAYLDLEDFFRLEGLAYRLVPLKASQEGMFGEPVGCDTDIMYNNIMNQFVWGGLDDTTKNIYMDENNLRFTTNQRLQMMTLAKLLNDEGKGQKAVQVLDKCLAVMPEKHVPYEPAMVYMVQGYFTAGAADKGKKLSRQLFDMCEEEYVFYKGLNDKRGDYKSDVNRLQSAMQMLAQYAGDYGHTDMMTEYDGRLGKLGIQSPNQFRKQKPKLPFDTLLEKLRTETIPPTPESLPATKR
jgi:Protein of unknown function (DUF2723)